MVVVVHCAKVRLWGPELYSVVLILISGGVPRVEGFIVLGVIDVKFMRTDTNDWTLRWVSWNACGMFKERTYRIACATLEF